MACTFLIESIVVSQAQNDEFAAIFNLEDYKGKALTNWDLDFNVSY